MEVLSVTDGGSPVPARRAIDMTQHGQRYAWRWKSYKINAIFKWTNRDRHSSVCAFVHVWRISQPSGVSAGPDSESGSCVSRLDCGQTINRDWRSARFVSCLTVVNQCTVKAWIFLTPVQNAAKKKGILATHTFTSSRSVSHPHARRRPWKEKDAAVLSAERILCLNGCSMWRLCKSILISYNSSEKWKKLGLTESTVLGWQFLKFDLTLLINSNFKLRRTAHLQFRALISTTPLFPGVSSIISSFHNLNALIISSPILCPTFCGCRTFFYFSILEMFKSSQNHIPPSLPHTAQRTDLKSISSSYFNNQYIITPHISAQRQWHLWQQGRLNLRGW